MNWRTARTIALDSETTGVDVDEARIVELGAFSFSDGDLDSGQRLGTLINPGVAIPAEASAIHGIQDEHVIDKPNLDSVAWRFIDRVKAADIIVGYNWPFDAAVIVAELTRIHIELVEKWTAAIAGKPVLDSLVLVRFDDVGRYWKGEGRHKLGNVASRLRLQVKGKAHRASTDAETAARILHHFADHLPDDAHEASDLIARKRRQQDADYQAWKARQAAS